MKPVRLLSTPVNAFATGASDGAVISHAGRYARESVLVAFEMGGGVDWLHAWAKANPTEFFTRLFTKVITRELEVTPSTGIEDLIASYDNRQLAAPIHDAEFYEIEE